MAKSTEEIYHISFTNADGKEIKKKVSKDELKIISRVINVSIDKIIAKSKKNIVKKK